MQGHLKYFSLALLAATLILSGCGRNMYEQPKLNLYESSPFFENGAGSRPLPANTVSRTRGAVDPGFYSGAGSYPFEVTEDLLLRGQERYNIYCSPCHNYSGDGLGLIVQKGMKQPRSFHDPNVRNLPASYFYNAATNGFGQAMYPYASRITAEDRWAIAAYIKALQLSQFANLDDVPTEERLRLEQTQGALQ